MTPENKFCAHCGKSLDGNGEFCAHCGSPISGVQSTLQSAPLTPPPTTPIQPQVASEQIAAPTPAPTTPADDEKVIGVIPVSRKKGLFSFESFSLVVTERRMIFTLITKEIMKEQAAQLYSKGYARGLGNLLKQSSINDYISRRYFSKSPEDALRENPQNFALDRSSIQKIKFNTGFMGVSERDGAEGKLEIHSLSEKLSFMIKQNDCSTAKEVLKQAGISS